VIDVLRNGVKHGPVSADLFYGTPSPGNTKAEERFAANLFSITRQLRYSKDETRLALDLALFINGLPVATFELKNRLTKQTVEDAVQQYKRDRNPKELLFQFGRCMVHFAVDDQEVRMCTHLKAKDSWFLPFNRGFNDGAGNPPNESGLKTDYLWKRMLTKSGLTDIIENYAQVVEEKDDKGRKKQKQIFPRYHQLDVVRKLLADAKAHGVGKRYLIQHSAGSGKSNSIAWLAHQLIGLRRSQGDTSTIFDSVVMVTDRLVLDRQIQGTIKQFAQVSATVGHAEHSGDLRRFLKDGKKIIISTVQKFPFILDVLAQYTPVESYYRLMKTVDDDPEFDIKKAKKRLRRYVESHDHAIRQKAEIMVDHFHEQVIARRKIGGRARAMVICSGVARAIQYYHAMEAYLKERKSPYRAIVAFSGEHPDGGRKVTEAVLNGFPSAQIEKAFQQDPYRFLVVAEKFQTGYDEPLLHTMYVDKILSGIKAVQTLSRLNRAHPQKTDTFVLDFMNDADTMTMAFSDYYRTTILSEETDPNKLHDLKDVLDGHQVYAWHQVDQLVALFLGGAERDTLDPILDACVAVYNSDLDEDGQVDFKGKAKAFVRTYQFLASILPYTRAEWEKLSIFLNFLIPKLPAPKEEDLSKGILEAIDMDSYRNEVRETLELALPDQDGEIYPFPSDGGNRPAAEPELDRLSNIIKAFNDQFGNIDWKDADRIRQVIAEEIPDKVAADKAYQNAIKNSDKAAARLEHDRALQKVVIGMLADHTELFKQFSDNPSFKKWLSDTIFGVTYEQAL
jgi:type I site-specific restriction-modification system R (restriction) subunit